MTVKVQTATTFDEAFKSRIKESRQPEWLLELRRKAFDLFTESGYPTKRDEEWKYTDLKAVAGCQWPVGVKSAGIESASIGGEAASRIVFVDGQLDKDLSFLNSLPEGVLVKGFSEAYEDDVFRKHFSKVVEFDFNALAALNTAFVDSGVLIHVPENTKVDETIHIVFIATVKSASFPRILFVGEQGSEAEIVEMYTRDADEEYLTNSVTEVVLEKNARLIHTRVQRESHSAFHIGVSKARLARDSVYDTTNINLGGKIARHDANLEFTGEGGEAWVDGLYLVEEGQHSDTHSRIDHKVKNCVSHQTYKGILDGKSRAVFNGKVFVHKDASGTDAEQSNKNLLLSNDARVDTKPQLEIYNDDVKCAHGATVGQLEGEEMFYLLSRGLNEDLARNLLTYGFAEEIINKITIPSVKKELDEAVLNRLHAKL